MNDPDRQEGFEAWMAHPVINRACHRTFESLTDEDLQGTTEEILQKILEKAAQGFIDTPGGLEALDEFGG